MADRPKHTSNTKPVKKDSVFWASTAMSAHQEAIVPGVNNVGNMRPRVKGGKTKEVRAYVPSKQPIVETTDSHGTKTSGGMMSDISTIDMELSHIKANQVSLRDLCVEDKKRVANLIKELARVVEEKENAQQNLAAERNHYQEQILQLVEQQEMVLKEREDVQGKLLEYQNLIVKLQQDQQLHHLQQQREKQRKLQLTTMGKESRLKISPVPTKGVKDERNIQSKRATAVLPNTRFSMRDVPEPCSKPQRKGKGNEDVYEDNSSTEEEEGSKTPVELPSQNLYMNQLEESDVNEFSTQALPALSPRSGKVPPRSTSMYRPFTAMIDQELAKQQAALATVDLLSQRHQSAHGKERVGEHHAVDYESFTDTHFPASESVPPQRLQAMNSEEKRKAHMLQDEEEATGKAPQPGFLLLPQNYVSPEKAEIFSRFMHSQAQSHVDQDEHRHTENGVRNTTKDQQKKVLNERKGHRKKKRPPPSFGVFHPPVMSSTQKSSEIGDYVNSSLNSDRRSVTGKEYRSSQNNVDNLNDKIRNAGGENSDGKRLAVHCEERYSDDDDLAEKRGTWSSDQAKGSKPRGKLAQVEFSDQLAMEEGSLSSPKDIDGHLGVDPDYLSYYRNLSAAERKTELLKQRSMLLEEQNKLKTILSQQENKLMMKRSDAVVKVGAVKHLNEEDQHIMRKMQNSLEEMELRLAEKEQAVRREKEVLQQKRKEHFDRHASNHHQEMIKPENGMPVLSETEKKESSTSLKDEREETGMRENKVGLIAGVKDHKSVKQFERRHTAKSRDADKKNRPDSLKEDDALVRRLDYSFHSDADPDTAQSIELQTTANRGTTLPQDGGGQSNTNRNNDQHAHTLKDGQPLDGKVDAGTSMSFAHLTRDELNPHHKSNTAKMNVEKKRVAKNSTKAKKKRLSESPGEKTLAIIEIINSLDDLDGLGSPAVNSPPSSNTLVRSRRTGIGRTIDPPRKQPSKSVSSKPNMFQQTGIAKTFPTLHRTLPADKTNSPSLPPDWTIKARKTSPGLAHSTSIKPQPASYPIDHSELDLFHLPHFKEERIDGFRRLANTETDDSEDVTYDYDNDDDSNIDDIVNALADSFTKDVQNREGRANGDGEEENVWDAVVNDLNDVSSLKLPSNGDTDSSSLADDYFDGLNLKYDSRKMECADDSDILEEVFFVNL